MLARVNDSVICVVSADDFVISCRGERTELDSQVCISVILGTTKASEACVLGEVGVDV